ncbi:MAG: exosortase/archaeosortase family protein [Syntrophobacteraceae bacterium]
MSNSYGKRVRLLVVLLALGGFVFGKPAMQLFLSGSELYSHIPVVYCIIGYLLYKDRESIFVDPHSSPALGILMLIASGSIYAYGIANQSHLGQNDFFSLTFLAAAFYLVGIALSILGTAACRKASFSICLLLFTIPIPDFLLTKVILYLQTLSTASTVWVMDLLRVYPIREGFVLRLPEISIEVAEQCSGIRSSLALVLVSLLYGHFFLRTYAGKVLLVIFSLLIAPFKNGLRITTLTLLYIHWDKRIMSGSLHTSGGIPFFLLALVMLSLAMLLLAKMERLAFRHFNPDHDQATIQS